MIKRTEGLPTKVKNDGYRYRILFIEKDGGCGVSCAAGTGTPAIGRLSEVSVPTCLIIGDKDVREMLSIIEKLEQGIPGARKVVMHGVAHALNMERPEEFNRIVLDFLASL